MKFADSVMLSRIDDELVLLDKDRGVYYGLDATGFRMVTLLIENSNFDTVADLLCKEYDAPKERISRDLRQLTYNLVERGLLSDEA